MDGATEPNPRQGSQSGALEEGKTGSGLGGESRSLDRGRSVEPLDGVKTKVAEPDPRQGSHLGAPEESKRGAGVGGESRILDRGRSFEPLKGMKTKLEKAKRPNRR